MSTMSIERDPSIARGMGLKEKVALGLVLLAAAGGAAETADASKKAHPKQPKVKVMNYPDGSTVKVVKIKAKSVGFSNKFATCLAKAEKKEQPAPPVDPYAKCEGDVTVNVVARAVAKCRKGWMGGRAAARASVREKIHVLAWSRSIASGDAEVKAKTRIRDRVMTRASASVDCVKLSDKDRVPGSVPTPEVPPEQQIPPKDGTQGPGAGTPGQPGGPGSGGSPGNPNEGVICRDAADTSNGDQNASTQGELMYGTQVDQFGYCVGPAGELQ